MIATDAPDDVISRKLPKESKPHQIRVPEGVEYVDEIDFGTFVDCWLRGDCEGPDWCAGTDLDLSSDADFFDFAKFARYWLKGNLP